MTKFIIIGSGRRVQQDVLPVLNSIGFDKSEIRIYASRIKTIFVRDTLYDVFNFNDIDEIGDDSIVYVAVTPSAIFKVVSQIILLNASVKIIIDTPINDISLVNNFKNNNIWVAEDAAYLGHFLKNTINLNVFNVMILHKSAVVYHGIAFIESLLLNSYISFTVFGSHLMFCKKGIAIIIGKRDYENGEIWLNFKKLIFPNLNYSQIKLVGGLTDFDNVSYRFLELKRIGLEQMIQTILQNKTTDLINLTVAHEQFLKSQKINKYSFKKTLKYIVKFFVPNTLLNKFQLFIMCIIKSL
jgi:hypothetical protein